MRKAWLEDVAPESVTTIKVGFSCDWLNWLMQQKSTFQRMLHTKNKFDRMINVGVLCDICFVWQGLLSSDQKRGSAVLPLLSPTQTRAVYECRSQGQKYVCVEKLVAT